MIDDNVKQALEEAGVAYNVLEFEEPFINVRHAALMCKAHVANMAKTVAFAGPGGAIVITMAGNAKVDSRKFKDRFGSRPVTLEPEDVLAMTGYEVGNVTPLGIRRDGVQVFMDISLKRVGGKELAYPSGGKESHAVAIAIDDLYKAGKFEGLVDVCK